jgi:Asp/Glu/hydantoin racemase
VTRESRMRAIMHALREHREKSVLGIAKGGVLTALTLGQRFGIVSMLQNWICAICAISPRWE